MGGQFPLLGKSGLHDLGQGGQDHVQFGHDVKVHLGAAGDFFQQPGNFGNDLVADGGHAIGDGGLSDLQNLQIFFLAIESHAGHDQVGLIRAERAAHFLKPQVKAVAIQNLNFVTGFAEGCGALEDRKGGINRADVAVFVPFLANDRQALHAGRID